MGLVKRFEFGIRMMRSVGVDCRVAKIDVGDRAFESGNANLVAAVERTVKQDQDSCEHVRENIPERETQREPGQTEAGDKRGDVDPECSKRSDRTEDDQRNAGNATKQIQKVGSFVQPLVKTSDDCVNDLRGNPEPDEY